MANSPLDLLVAELLGDVGKLHAEVKALREAVPALSSELDASVRAAGEAVSAHLAESAERLAAESRNMAISVDRFGAAADAAAAVEQQITAFAGVSQDLKQQSEDLREQVGLIGVQVRAAAEAAQGAAIDYGHARQLLLDQIKKVETMAVDGIAAHHKKTLALTACLIVSTALVAGLGIGRLIFSKPTAAERFAELNNTNEMLECRNGYVWEEARQKFCVLSVPGIRQAQVKAWRVQ